MPPSTITRVTWTDDDGTGTTGTIINNARLQADIYAAIDQMFSGGGSYTVLTLGGRLAVEGFGDHLFSANAVGSNTITVRNLNAGQSYGALIAQGDTAEYCRMLMLSTTANFGGLYSGVRAMVDSNAVAGLVVNANAGPLIFGQGAIERARITAFGLTVTGGFATSGWAMPSGLGITGQNGSPTRGQFVFGDGTGYNVTWNRVNVGTGALVNLLTIDDRGWMYGQLQPYVQAFNTAGRSVTSTNTLTYDSESYDVSGNFASNTFTAPVTGDYLITINQSFTNGSGATQNLLIGVVAGGITYYLGYYNNLANGGQASCSGSLILRLSVGQTVVAQYLGTGTVTQDGNGTIRQGTFCCRLLV